MRNSTTQHRYSRIPEEPANDEECKAPDDHVPLHLTCTFGWVTGRLGTNQKSRDGLVPGQHSTWGNSRNLRQAWIKHARNAETRETDPQLWRAILAFVPAEEYIRLVLLLVVIVSTRVLQPTMFAAVLSSEPVLLYGSPVPWICFVTAGYWLAVSCEGLARSHYSFFAQLTSASVKSGLTGLVYDKVLRLKETTLADYATSHVMNLISKDLEPIDKCAYLAPFLLTAPVELLAFSLLLIAMIGWEAIIGIAYMLLCTLLRCGIGRVYRKLRQHTAFFTDQRLRFLSEVFSGIRAIKMNVWERAFERLIKNIRRKELHYIKRKSLVLGTLFSVQHAVPIISSLVSIATLLLLGKDLTAINVFLIILTMYILDASCGDSFVIGTEALIRTLARLRRIEKFLLVDFPAPCFFETAANRSNHRGDGRGRSHSHTENGDLYGTTPPSTNSPYLSLSGVCCEGEYEMNDIELNYITCSYKGAQLVTITGPPNAGAGTSLVLQAILREVSLTRGLMVQKGKIAYVGQTPWVFSGTLRENVLFGESYKEDRFLAVIRACKLEEDIGILSNGDMTIIGEGGTKLTLGQRERINLARAAYSSASLILLDNPISHVETGLANEIFDECIQSFLAPRLRLVVTRRKDFLARSPRVLFMTDGIILREGSLAKIQESGENLTWLKTDSSREQEDEQELEGSRSGKIQEVTQDTVSDERFSEQEGFAVYVKYARQAGMLPLLLVIGVLLIAAPGAVLAALGLWFARIAGLSLEQQHRDVHFHVTTLLVGSFLLLLILRAFFLLVCGLRSAKRIHERGISTLLKAPVQVIEGDTQGALLKTFSKDMECLDEKLPPDILRFFQSVIEHVAAVIVIKITTPWAILAAVPAAVILLFIGKYYLRLERTARGLESDRLKLVMTHFSDTIDGAMTIRAFQKEKYFSKEFCRLQDQYMTAVCMRSAAEQWLALRHLAVVSLFMCIATVIVIFTSDITLVALSLTYDRQLVVGIALVPLLFTDIEQDMSSAARLLSYFDMRSEPGYDNVTKPPEDWPREGSVSISDSLMTYTPRRRVSFQTMTLDIAAGEKVCVTGERDAKESQLVANMLRLNESRGETVTVDELPLKYYNLQEARRAFSVVQRHPFIFTTSLRENLDPEGNYEDGDLWSALEAVRMQDYVEELPRQLNYIMTQPSIFSYSHQMLLTLARTLLQKRRIIILDEIMSSVDFNTFRIIRDVVKQKLGNCTVITVAYGPVSRDTVVYHDRVVVMEGGRIVEMDTPRALLERQHSLLAGFVIQT